MHYQFKGCIIWYSIELRDPWEQSWLSIRVQFPIDIELQTVQEAIDCVSENTEALLYDVRRYYPSLLEYIEIVRRPIDGLKIVDVDEFRAQNIPVKNHAGWINTTGRSSWISIHGKTDFPQGPLSTIRTKELIITEYGGYVIEE